MNNNQLMRKAVQGTSVNSSLTGVQSTAPSRGNGTLMSQTTSGTKKGSHTISGINHQPQLTKAISHQSSNANGSNSL